MNIGSSHLYDTNTMAAHLVMDNDYHNKFVCDELNVLNEFEHRWGLILHLENVAEQQPQNLRNNWCIDIASGKYSKKGE